MKKKALVMVLLCVMGLTAICIGSAEAAQWYTCKITYAGATTWGCFVRLTDTEAVFTDRLFVLDSSSGNEKAMLATALSAWANNRQVWVYIASSAEYSTVTGMFAIK